MKTKQIRNSCLLLITALIWGSAFVAQSAGCEVVGPYTLNCIRFIIGGFVLMPVIALLDRMQLTERRPRTKKEKRTLFIGGAACGAVLFCASTVQQLGLYFGTGAGKAGFLTTCYILLVPIFGIFLKKKCGWNIWFGVILTLIGLYLLCIKESLTLQFSDGLVMFCAVLFAGHILTVDHFSPLTDGVRLSCIQFFVCGTLGIIPMFFIEMNHSLAGIAAWSSTLTTIEAWIPILYTGVFSCGIAYTLQVVGQDGLNPTIASLLMSLESVFSVLTGWLILHERLSQKEMLGCVLIFAAVVIAQIPMKKK